MESAAINRIGDMLDVIQNNPYRILGVYSNSPLKERIANQNRLKAYLSVGKLVSFPLDLTAFLPQIDRTPDAVSQANSQLTLPTDQLRYAQFWFIHANSFDIGDLIACGGVVA